MFLINIYRLFYFLSFLVYTTRFHYQNCSQELFQKCPKCLTRRRIRLKLLCQLLWITFQKKNYHHWRYVVYVQGPQSQTRFFHRASITFLCVVHMNMGYFLDLWLSTIHLDRNSKFTNIGVWQELIFCERPDF